MIATAILASIVALVFAALGLAKILAQPAMRERAAHLGFSTAAYRRIGVLESAAALGVALGPAVPVLGGLAGAGLLLLLAGAVTMHVRHRDTARAIAPAIVCAMLVTGLPCVTGGGIVVAGPAGRVARTALRVTGR